MRKLHRSSRDKKIAGVCGGIAETYEIDVVLVRILFAIVLISGFGSPILFYLVLWIVMPEY